MTELNKQDSVFTTLAAVGRLGLMLIGLIGLSVEIFRDKGWLKQLLGKMLDSPLGLASFPIAIVILYLLNLWLSGASNGKVAKGDFPMYFMMAVGAFFLYELITTGTF
jgi:hypothetical protein